MESKQVQPTQDVTQGEMEVASQTVDGPLLWSWVLGPGLASPKDPMLSWGFFSWLLSQN